MSDLLHNAEIAATLVEIRRLREAMKSERTRLIRCAVSLGIPQEDALKLNVEVFFDGFLVARGIARDAEIAHG